MGLVVYIRREAKEETMTNINRDDEELAKLLNRSLNASYLRTHIKEPLEEFRTLLLAGRKIFSPESTDVVLLLIFTYIDLLGYLYKGRTLSSNAVEFMRGYLGRVDKRYEEVGGLLYDALRHGLVHLSTPKRIQLQNGMILDFLFVHAEQRQDHLKVTKSEEIETGGRVEIHRLSVDVDLLYEDLLSAIDIYADDIRHNQALSDTFWKAFEKRRKAKEAELLNKSYIQDSDFDFVRKQISNL